eukprot:5053857-Pleurochrysis_carterae.AAC.1
MFAHAVQLHLPSSCICRPAASACSCPRVHASRATLGFPTRVRMCDVLLRCAFRFSALVLPSAYPRRDFGRTRQWQVYGCVCVRASVRASLCAFVPLCVRAILSFALFAFERVC